MDVNICVVGCACLIMFVCLLTACVNSVVVVSCGTNGSVQTEFSLRLCTLFGRLKQFWCKHQELACSDVVFEYCGDELVDDDTLSSRCLVPADGPLMIHAVPRPREEQVAVTSE